MSQRVLVTSADAYEFKDDEGNMRKGVSINFLNDYRDDSEHQRGCKPSKMSAPVDFIESVLAKTHTYPAVCELGMVIKPGKEGKPTVTLRDFKYICPVPLEKIFNAVPTPR